MVLRCAWLYFICLLRAEVKTTRSSDLYLTIRFTMKFTIEHRDRVAIVTSTVEKLDALHAPDLKAELVQHLKDRSIGDVAVNHKFAISPCQKCLLEQRFENGCAF